MDPSIDIVKILGYGLAGFSFLLVFLAFMLLRKEQDRDTPRKMIIQTIWLFMGLCTILTIVVGLLSIPIINSNNRKEALIAELNTKIHINNQADSIVKSIEDLKVSKNPATPIDTVKLAQVEQSVMTNLGNIEQHAAPEALSANSQDSSMASLTPIKADIARDFSKLRQHPHADSVQLILNRIQTNTRLFKVKALEK